MSDALTVRERMALEVESAVWSRATIGNKDTAIRTTLGMSPIRHAQVVDALLDRPEAEAAYPMLVRRLRRLRTARAAQRGSKAG